MLGAEWLVKSPHTPWQWCWWRRRVVCIRIRIAYNNSSKGSGCLMKTSSS